MSQRTDRLLTDRETELTIRILEQALDYHLEWLADLHVSLICDQPFDGNTCEVNAHELCKLGQWYYNEAPEALKSYPEFQGIEEVHRDMHDLARRLAESKRQGDDIGVDEYAGFHQAQRVLVKQLHDLRDELLKTLYSFDCLTGAINRHAFVLIAEKEHALTVRTGGVYSIALIDLDYFKKINDNYGHIAGDKVLQYVARHFMKNIRDSDSFCRYGGEEFLLFLPDTSGDDTYTLLENIRESLAQKQYKVDGNDNVHVTASIGIAQWRPEMEIEEVIAAADKCLYAAKAAGRNNTRIQP